MKTISRKAFERNVREGKFIEVLHVDADGARVIPREIRGNYENVPNDRGVIVEYEFKEAIAERLAKIETEHQANEEAARARLRAMGAKV